MPIFLSKVGGSLAAGLLALLWLLALGAGAELESPLSYAVLALVLTTFWMTHVHSERPAGWHFARLHRPRFHWLVWGLVSALLLTCWRLLLVLNFGDAAELAAATQRPSPWTLVTAVVAAPLIEEFGFRLWLQSQLERWLPALLAIALASALFSVVHDLRHWYLHAASGLLYGLALWFSGSIWLPVLMHAVANGSLAILQGHSGVAGRFSEALAAPPHWLDEATMGITVCLLLALWAGVFLRRTKNRS